jgi:hypothetical protein
MSIQNSLYISQPVVGSALIICHYMLYICTVSIAEAQHERLLETHLVGRSIATCCLGFIVNGPVL